MSNFSVSTRRWFPIMFLWQLYEKFIKHLPLCRFISTYKPSIGFVSTSSKFDGISSLHIIRYLHLTSHYLTCKVYWNHLLQNSPRGKLSSIFVSEIIRTSMCPLTWSTSNLNLFLSDFIFIRLKTDLFVFSRPIDYKIGLASIIFLSSSEKLDFHLSWFNLEFSSI